MRLRRDTVNDAFGGRARGPASPERHGAQRRPQPPVLTQRSSRMMTWSPRRPGPDPRCPYATSWPIGVAGAAWVAWLGCPLRQVGRGLWRPARGRATRCEPGATRRRCSAAPSRSLRSRRRRHGCRPPTRSTSHSHRRPARTPGEGVGRACSHPIRERGRNGTSLTAANMVFAGASVCRRTHALMHTRARPSCPYDRRPR